MVAATQTPGHCCALISCLGTQRDGMEPPWMSLFYLRRTSFTSVLVVCDTFRPMQEFGGFPHNHPTKRIQPGTDRSWEKTCKDNKLFCFNQKHSPWCREGSWGHMDSPSSPAPPPSPARWGLALQPLPLACPHLSLGTQAGPCCCAAAPSSRLEHTAPLAPRSGHRAQARTLSAHNPPLTQLVRRPFEAFFQLTARQTPGSSNETLC